MDKIISSPNNQKIKDLEKLAKGRERRRQDLILIDGRREIAGALNAGLKVREIFYCPELDSDNKVPDNFKQNLTILNPKAFKKIAYKENPDGFIAVAEPRYLKLEDLKLPKRPLLVILEAIEKPGNFGAIIRTATAAKVDAIILNDQKTDIYNPNIIRASQGLVFSQPIISADITTTKAWLKTNKISAIGAVTKTKNIYTNCDFKKSTALIFGSEALGLSSRWLSLLDKSLRIPMAVGVDSLNVSVSAALMIYEAQRQRDFVDF